MKTFFETCIYICICLIVFTLAVNFIHTTLAFPATGNIGQQTSDTSTALSAFTGLDNTYMNSIWGIATGVGAIAAIGLAWITHSISPVGIYLYSLVFWTSYIRAWAIISYGHFFEATEGIAFILIFTVAIMFIFIASIIGMLTGSG